MIIQRLYNREPEELEHFFNHPRNEGIDDNREKLRFMVYDNFPKYVSYHRYIDIHELISQYTNHIPTLPSLNSKIVPDMVMYKGEKQSGLHTFEDIIHFAFNRLQKEKDEAAKTEQEKPSAIAEKAYKLYIDDFFGHIYSHINSNAWNRYYNARDEDDYGGDFSDYISTRGLGFSMHTEFNDFGKFLHAEYLDTEYMKTLFDKNEYGKKKWNEYIEDVKRYDMEEEMERC